LGRSAKLYLCQQHTGIEMADIGGEFWILESGASQANKHITAKLNTDRRLNVKYLSSEKIDFVKNEDRTPILFFL